MSNKISRTTVSLALGTSLAALAGVQLAIAGENPFTLNALQSGYKMVAEAKCGAEKKAAEAKCGAEKKATEGKCGEGKCGADK